MATAAKVTDYPHIVKTPGVRAGKARIDGTRICVIDVAMQYEGGRKPEEIQTHFSSRPLTLAEVMSALAYHYDHPHELAEYLERSRKAVEEHEQRRDEYIRTRSSGYRSPAEPRDPALN